MLYSLLGSAGAGLVAGFMLARLYFRSLASAADAERRLALERGDSLKAERDRFEALLRSAETYRHELHRRYQAVLADYRRGVEEAREELLRNPDTDEVRDRLGRLGRVVPIVPDPKARGGGA